MSKNLNINILYTTQVKSSGDTLFKVISCFSEREEISERILSDIYFELFSKGIGEGIVFSSLDDLGEYTLKICSELQSPMAYLLSNTDFNLGVDSSHDLISLRSIFQTKGTLIELPEGDKSKSLFDKFF